MPMLGSEGEIAWSIPSTVAGWIVWIISKLSSAGFNVAIFHCFNKQGKINISSDANYLEARKLLLEADESFIKHPRTPNQFHKEIYGKKGLTIFLTTLLGTIGLSNSLLQFNPTEFICQLLTLIAGIIAGIFQMKDTETFWTTEYLELAKDISKKRKEKPDD